jgi:hypothetical protein
MEKYIISFLISTESTTQGESIATFTDLTLAQKEYKKVVKTSPRYRQSAEDDFREYLTESIVLELWIDDDFEETLMQEVIYSEGVIDRMNWKGDYPINYYSKATFNGKELMHEMYFQGKKQMWGKKHKVPHSKLQDWYYR